jgi:putative peptidoglycan lipid II flippase
VTNHKTENRQSYLDAILSSVFWTSLDRGASLFKHILIASAIGLTADMDVFYMAIGLLGLLVFSWSRIADVIAVPRLIEFQKCGNIDGFNRFAGSLFTLTLLFSLLLTGIMLVAWPLITHLALGFDAGRRTTLLSSIYWLIPIALLYIPMRLLCSVARARRSFSVVYQSEFIISLVILGCVAGMTRAQGVLLWSYSLGVACAFAYLMAVSWNKLRFFRNPLNPETGQLLRNIPALLLLYGAQYLYSFVDKQFVSFLPTGTVSAITYSWTLINVLPSMINLGGAFITVYAETREDKRRRNQKINDLLSGTLSIGVSVTLFLWAFSEDFIGLLLERGAFTRENTLLVARCTSFLAFSTIPIALMPALGQIFQVEQRLDYIVKRVLLGVSINALLCSLFLFQFRWGAEGVALATSISQWTMLLASLASAKRLGITLDLRRHAIWLAYLIPMALLGLYASKLAASLTESYWRIFPTGIAFFAIMLLGAKVSSLRDAELLRNLLYRSLKKIRIVSS